jgi:hypothetical protein
LSRYKTWLSWRRGALQGSGGSSSLRFDHSRVGGERGATDEISTKARLAQIEKANNTTFELVRLDTKLVYLPDDIASRIDVGFLSRDIRFGSMSHAGHYEPVPEACPHFFKPIDQSKGFKWLQIASAGIDRPIYSELMARGIRVSTGAGTHAESAPQFSGQHDLALRGDQERRHVDFRIERTAFIVAWLTK